MRENLRVITDDVFGIARRIKEIDSRYFVVYNEAKKRYEVHSSENKGDTLSLVCPYESLDARVIKLVRATRRENAKQIFSDVEQHNEKIEKAESERQADESRYRAKELLEKYKYNSRR